MTLLLCRITKTTIPMSMLKRTIILCLSVFSLSELAAQVATQPAVAEYDSTYIEGFLEGIPAGTAKLVGMRPDTLS
jgi:hypothetical protein